MTDPSYRGQLVCMTYPLIGNYGINAEDVESRRPWVNGFIVKEACRYPSSWRGQVSIETYMREHGIVGIQGIDTRALTRHLRDHGAQEGIISTVEADAGRLVEKARALPGLIGRDLVSEVSVTERHGWSEGEWNLAKGYTKPPARALQGGRLRLRDQAQYPARARLARLRGRGGAREYARGRRAREEAGRSLPLERPRRSRSRALSRASRCAGSSARRRSSASASGTRFSAWPSAATPTSSSSATTAPITR